jgi:hypothetical protein
VTSPSVCLLLLLSVEHGGEGPAAPQSSPPATTPPAITQPGGPARSADGSARAGSKLGEILSRIDALHKQRDDRGAFGEEQQLVKTALGSMGSDYRVLWRAARLYFWLSDDPSVGNDQRSKLGKIGWDLAERAIAVDPKQGDGYYWAAVNMGNYALGLGVVKALTMGLEGSFKARLQRASELLPGYEHGGIDVAWGRFYEKLPWPKRDRKKAEQHLRRVLAQVNDNLRARVYLADTLSHDDRAAEAKKLLEEVAAATPGRYDAPEERRAKALAVGLMRDVIKSMN